MKRENSMKKIDFFKLACDSIQPGNKIWYSGGENNEITPKEITKKFKENSIRGFKERSQ